MTITLHPSIYVHPGDFLRSEVIEAHGLNLTDAAARLGVPQDALHDLLGGHVGLSADMAGRFEDAFGVRADTLMRMQAAYDLARDSGEVTRPRMPT